MRILYDIVFFIFSIFYLPVFLIKGKHKNELGSRFGKVPPEVKQKLLAHRVFWVHAVSVGEVVQAVRLINALKEKLAGWHFLLTTTTVAGREIAEKLKSVEDTVLAFPVDFRFSVRSFVEGIRPEVLVILETEIWPNLFFELFRRNVPVFIVNGRLSDPAMARYEKVRVFLKPVLEGLSGIFAQDERMRARFLKLGAKKEFVWVTGNMKFDWMPKFSASETIEKITQSKSLNPSFLCVAGSTHEGEEDILFAIYPALRTRVPDFQLAIAPRHIERIPAIEQKAARNGIETRRFSSLAQSNGNAWSFSGGGVVLLIDKMGMLADLYSVADIVFIGGSLVNRGGHNLVEPAFFERPILFGPYMNNFREMAVEFKKAAAAVEVKNGAELEAQILGLKQDEEKRRAMGLRAKELVFRHQGATQKNTEAILKVCLGRIKK